MERKRGKQERECGGSPLCRYDGFQWRKSKAPASNFTEMVASQVREEKGKRRGDRGHFIGAYAGKKRAGIEAGA
jgi:hypothetical protein